MYSRNKKYCQNKRPQFKINLRSRKRSFKEDHINPKKDQERDHVKNKDIIKQEVM